MEEGRLGLSYGEAMPCHACVDIASPWVRRFDSGLGSLCRATSGSLRLDQSAVVKIVKRAYNLFRTVRGFETMSETS